MHFVDPVFVPFLAVVVLVSRRLPTARLQNLLLLAASVLFYGWKQPQWVGILGASVAVDWWAARRLDAKGGRGPLLASLAVNLGILGTFKYADFVVDAVAQTILAVGGPPISWRPGVPLPPGVSFFTFQSMAYTLDVYFGRVRARQSWVVVGAHIAAFPQLVAGPIERAGDLLPQLERRRTPTIDDTLTGISLMCWGAVQKLVVADTVGLWVDAAFADRAASPVVVWAAVVGFMVQILADFSGYTDLARGAARLLGLRLSANFDRPFLAASPSEFWRRWHQTFSRWMHDYVYVPLGGGKKGVWRSIFAATTSLLLAGLWHGAAWNFVAWGAWFAGVWVLWRLGRSVVPSAWTQRLRPLGVVLTLAVVAVGMLLFREPELSRAGAVMSALPWHGSELDRAVALGIGGVALAGGLVLTAGGAWARRIPTEPGWRLGGMWALALGLVWVFWSDAERDFVYFQF